MRPYELRTDDGLVSETIRLRPLVARLRAEYEDARAHYEEVAAELERVETEQASRESHEEKEKLRREGKIKAGTWEVDCGRCGSAYTSNLDPVAMRREGMYLCHTCGHTGP